MSNGDFSIEIKMAPREWARQVYTAVVRSLPKTVAEPVTNSDTSYKRKFSLPDASGLVEAALALQKGSKFDLSQAKAELKGQVPEREIQIHLYTAKGHIQPPETCEVVDYAEGMNPEELRKAFEEFAGDKAEVSKGRPGRSLFGRGVSDVLLGHKQGEFYSYKDGVLSKLEFFFDPKKDSAPKATGQIFRKPSAAVLSGLHFQPKENGSCVRFVLHGDCRIPQEGTVIPILAQFYMLRLINADPNTKVKLFQYRASKKITQDTLDYDFPIGDVIERFSFMIEDPVSGAGLPALGVDGIVCRANVKGGLPGSEAREQRANGLLIVDDKDAVLDLTFLPKFERAPYLANIFGIVRIKAIRNVFEWFLNNGKDSPLLTSRDGFDDKHEFTRSLFVQLEKYLEPVYHREEERYSKGSDEPVPAEVRERIDAAIKELNKLLKDLIGEGEDGSEHGGIDEKLELQFVPRKTKLVIGKRRVVRLYFRKDLAKSSGSILYDTVNPKLKVKPLSHIVSEGRDVGSHLAYDVFLECDSLHESGRIVALAEGRDSTYEAGIDVVDVTAGGIITAPDEMEFRPREAHGQPNRNNTINLFVNSAAVPVGRKIRVEIEKARGAIGFIEDGQKTESLIVTFEKAYVLPGTNAGRIPITWQGTGWGQAATVCARTKKPDGSAAYAEGRIVLEEPEETGGMIKDVEYRELQSDRCSDLVDGKIYINSNHFLNRVVFGPTKSDYLERIGESPVAQYRFASLVLEQAVYRLAEETHTKGRLVILTDAPVTSLREFIDTHTQKFAPRIVKAFVTKKLG